MGGKPRWRHRPYHQGRLYIDVWMGVPLIKSSHTEGGPRFHLSFVLLVCEVSRAPFVAYMHVGNGYFRPLGSVRLVRQTQPPLGSRVCSSRLYSSYRTVPASQYIRGTKHICSRRAYERGCESKIFSKILIPPFYIIINVRVRLWRLGLGGLGANKSVCWSKHPPRVFEVTKTNRT